jgi:hypothetical protein
LLRIHDDAARTRRVPVAAELIDSEQYDYADAFEIRVAEPDAHSAEQWARTALEQAPRSARWTMLLAFRGLGLRLGPRSSPDHILGWRIVASQPDVIHLEAVSPLLRGVVVGRRVDPTCAVVTTFVFYKRPVIARVAWAIAGPVHRRIVPYLLAHAAADRNEPGA